MDEIGGEGEVDGSALLEGDLDELVDNLSGSLNSSELGGVSRDLSRHVLELVESTVSEGVWGRGKKE